MNEDLVGELEGIAAVHRGEGMAKHTTFRVGGPADTYVTAQTEDQLRQAFAVASRYKAEVLVLGNGSNILVGDKGFQGVVIKNDYDEVEEPRPENGTVVVRAGSGTDFPKLAQNMARLGLGGIEWAVGIPGSLGGAIVSNAGVKGWELKDVLVSARLGTPAGKVIEATPEDLGLSYRHSELSEGGSLRGHVVLTVDLRLTPGEPEALRERIREYQAKRNESQPAGKNCGSVFKNPPEAPAWDLVRRAGLAGVTVGGAQFSEKHTNFIMNLGNASAKDVLSLIRLAQQRVRDRAGVELEPEVQLVGEFA
jgi:UDP-N-acetylmuramate dehydrogenase